MAQGEKGTVRTGREGGGAVESEWVGGRFRAPAYVTGEGPAYRPDVIVWLELGRNRLHLAKLVRPNEPNAVIIAALEQALAAARTRPAAVRVADQATAELLRAHMGSKLEVRHGPTPEVQPILDDLSRKLNRVDAEESYLAGGATIAAVGRLFRAAAKLYRIAPWRIVSDDTQVFGLDVPSLGVRRGCISIIGAGGRERGLLFFQSVADFHRFLTVGARHERGDEPRHLGLTLFSLCFLQGSELPLRARREIGRHGWEVVDVYGYPWLEVVEPDLVERPASARDVLLASVLAEATAAFMDRHRALFGALAPTPVSEALLVGTEGGDVPVTVVAPHPQARWRRNLSAAEAEVLRRLNEERAEAGQLIEAFARAEAARGRAARWVDDAQAVARALYDFKIDEHDGEAHGLGAEAVERFLLDYVPERVPAGDDLIGRVPEMLRALVEWLAGAGELDAAKADAICQRVKKIRRRFRRYAAAASAGRARSRS